MISIVVIMAIVVCAGWVFWKRSGRWRTQAVQRTPEGPSSETAAFEAFTHGNSCLAEGKFTEATTSFERARELDPKRPHVADRLAEVQRRQHAAIATLPVSTPS